MKYRQLTAIGLGVWLALSGPEYMVLAENATETVTETPKPTEASTEAPKPTEAPTEAPKPTEAPTEAPKPTEAPSETSQSTEASSELITDAPGTEMPSETAPDNSQSESSTEGNTSGTEASESESETGLSETVPAESEQESETETEKKTDKDGLLEEESEKAKKEPQITNAQLVARQNIVTPPDITLEFRFVQVDKVYAVVKNPEGAKIREKKDKNSDIVGTLEYHGLCYLLEDKNSDWVYVESGEVRGFLSAGDIVTGDEAKRLVSENGENAFPLAVSTMEYSDNSAYTYTHTTVRPVLAEKVYGVARENLNIYEAKQENARITGTLGEGGLCYILADAGQNWVYVESGNARGFVQAAKIYTGLEAIQRVSETGEISMSLASVRIEPKDNAACYYTLTSVRKASQDALIRSDMVNYSFQFLGNPYVWGGTSLTNGCDCSGFTQSIYSHFGYYIPRVAEAQAVYGMQIPVSSAAPGDLIFYAKNGSIYHVSMYIGNGKVIHAAGTNLGIITSGIGSTAVWATRVI